jgi:hypothetical protein
MHRVVGRLVGEDLLRSLSLYRSAQRCSGHGKRDRSLSVTASRMSLESDLTGDSTTTFCDIRQVRPELFERPYSSGAPALCAPALCSRKASSASVNRLTTSLARSSPPASGTPEGRAGVTQRHDLGHVAGNPSAYWNGPTPLYPSAARAVPTTTRMAVATGFALRESYVPTLPPTVRCGRHVFTLDNSVTPPRCGQRDPERTLDLHPSKSKGEAAPRAFPSAARRCLSGGRLTLSRSPAKRHVAWHAQQDS